MGNRSGQGNQCAWPVRLESLLNGVAGMPLFRVATVALGGTNTATGNTLWSYNLLPDSVSFPDILVNSYSTNDMHVEHTEMGHVEHTESSIMRMQQQFIRSVLRSPDGCRKPPLLIYLDDYVGNEQNEILRTMALSSSLNLLGSYYGIATVSYADGVREM